MATVNRDNFMEYSYDVFRRFNRQHAVVAAGVPGNFNAMTLGWGMMGNIWGHPGAALTIYVRPDRYTHEFLMKYDCFTVSFFPEAQRQDVMLLGTVSGRDRDKIAMTALTPKPVGETVGFEEAELTFVCRKISAQPFALEHTPPHMAAVYAAAPTHTAFIGYIEDAFGEI